MEYGSEPLIKNNNDYLKAYNKFRYDFQERYNIPFDELNDYEQDVFDDYVLENHSIINRIFFKECERLEESNTYYYGCSFDVYKSNYESRLTEFIERYKDVNEVDFIESELKLKVYYFLNDFAKKQINYSLKLRNEFLEQMKDDIQNDDEHFDMYERIEDVTENDVISLLKSQYYFLFQFYNQLVFFKSNPALENNPNYQSLYSLLGGAYNYNIAPYTIPDEDLLKYFKNYCLTNKAKKSIKFCNLILFELETLITGNKKNEKNILNITEIDKLEYSELQTLLFYSNKGNSSIKKKEVTSDDLYFVIIQKIENLKSRVKEIFSNIVKENETFINNSFLQKTSEAPVLNNTLTDENIYLGQPTNDKANNLFEHLVQYYRPDDKTSVKFINILYFLRNNVDKKLYIFKIKQEDFRILIQSKTGIIITKFAKSERYTEDEIPILNSLEGSFRKQNN